MVSKNGNSGANSLARVIQGRVRAMSQPNLPALDYGVIQEDMSLLTNSFKQPIPKSDYMVCASAAEYIAPGLHVIAAWIGNDVCVIDVIIPAQSI